MVQFVPTFIFKSKTYPPWAWWTKCISEAIKAKHAVGPLLFILYVNDIHA